MDVESMGSAGTGLPRRRFLQSVGAAGLVLGSGAALSACSRSSSTTSPSTSASRTGTARRGGTLRIGMVGAGKSESFNPGGSVAALVNLARVSAVFDPLVNIGPDLALVPALATQWSANADSTEWTFTLRDGVTFHDGKPLSVDDVIYSLGGLRHRRSARMWPTST